MIALGCDHGGYELKQEIKKYLDEKGIEYKDYGCDSLDSVDYPIYAKKVAHAILDGECEIYGKTVAAEYAVAFFVHTIVRKYEK